MTDIPTLANGGAPASPAPSPQAAPAPASTAPPAAAPRPSAPENPRSRGFSPARDYREAVAARAAGEAPGEAPASPAGEQQPQPPADTGAKVKVGKYEVSEQEVGELMTEKAARDLRTALIPPTADAYKLEISPGAKLPGDMTVKFEANDPGLIAAKNWAHGKGLDQSAFSEMLTLYASHRAQEEATLAARSREEIAKAGVNAGMRVDAVGRWLDGFVGTADAAPIKATLVTNSHLEFFEKVMRQLEGGASFSQSHRVAPDAEKIPGYENMSFEQRRYAQDTLASRRNSR
jgi:hypothetical protein